MKKFNVYTVISIVAFLILIFILLLPNFFNINKKKNRTVCIKNMKILYNAIENYTEERQKDFNGTQEDLIRTGYLKKAYICPSGKPSDKYIISGEFNGEIVVKCTHEKKLPKHKLPESFK